MNNNYIKPEITIIKFNEKDIITGSAESYDRIDEDGQGKPDCRTGILRDCKRNRRL